MLDQPEGPMARRFGRCRTRRRRRGSRGRETAAARDFRADTRRCGRRSARCSRLGMSPFRPSLEARRHGDLAPDPRKPPLSRHMTVVLSPQRAKTDGGSNGYGRREAQGRDHRRLGKPDGLPPAGHRGRAGTAVRAGLLSATWRPDDLAERDPLDLYGAALAQLRSAELRQPGEVKLRVYNPKLEQNGWQSTHTVVEIVNDDMPFLVDSVGDRAQPPRPEHPPGDPPGVGGAPRRGRQAASTSARPSRSATGCARASCCSRSIGKRAPRC